VRKGLMNPSIIVYGVIIFFACMSAHIIIWRIKIPKMSALLLVFMFLVIPTICVLIIAIGSLNLPDRISFNKIELLEILILHLSLSLAYIASYPAARAFSPSLDILLIISSAAGKRMTEEDIITEYVGTKIVPPRLDTLRIYNLISENGGLFRLKPLGMIMIKIFILYRKLLGIPAGGG